LVRRKREIIFNLVDQEKTDKEKREREREEKGNT
jgi:hypothetical protein